MTSNAQQLVLEAPLTINLNGSSFFSIDELGVVGIGANGLSVDALGDVSAPNNLNVGGDLSVNGGASVLSSGALYSGGIQVVGARGAAVANATDAATVITQLNALLARLRTHGLIA